MNHRAEIIAVGTELLLGNIANTDAQDISQALSELGIDTYFHTVVGDNPERLKSVIEIARRRSDIIITVGGLGPTYDDLTKQTLAEAFGLKLVYSEKDANDIIRYFTERWPSIPLTENNLRQAYLPEGCTIFHNTCGTAPGCAFEVDGVRVIMLPGPPRECKAMLRHSAVPYLQSLSDESIFSHNIHVYGKGESEVESLLHGLMERLTNPTLATYAKEGEVMLRLTVKAKNRELAEELMAPIFKQVRDTLGDVIYGVDTGNLETTVMALLEESGKTFAVAESCTGGLMAKRITDLPGSSRVFQGGIVSYSDLSKTKLLGVSDELLNDKGAVSPEVAVEMAKSVKALLGSSYGIGITGIAGPGTDERGTPVGTMYIALAADDGVYIKDGLSGMDRARSRIHGTNRAFDMLRRHMTGLNPGKKL
ncbi:MAG: competence/damage-inducible protein A [Oscillospiraceae bacterium]|nr:competence/damage-inducible protein A [Oscillospiraceae bacterium]